MAEFMKKKVAETKPWIMQIGDGKKENWEHIATENEILFWEDKEANQIRAPPVYGKSEPR